MAVRSGGGGAEGPGKMGWHLLRVLMAGAQTHTHTSCTTSRGFGWRIHCGVEVTELSTNKQHSLSAPHALVKLTFHHRGTIRGTGFLCAGSLTRLRTYRCGWIGYHVCTTCTETGITRDGAETDCSHGVMQTCFLFGLIPKQSCFKPKIG